MVIVCYNNFKNFSMSHGQGGHGCKEGENPKLLKLVDLLRKMVSEIFFGKLFFGNFLKKSLKFDFLKKTTTNNFNFLFSVMVFTLLCNYANLGHETWKKS